MTTAKLQYSNNYLITEADNPELDNSRLRYVNNYLITEADNPELDNSRLRYVNNYLITQSVAAPLDGFSTSSVRPRFRVGSLPYLEHLSQSRFETILPEGYGDTWEWIAYLPDGTYDEQQLTLPSGRIVELPKINFNQVALVPAPLSSDLRKQIKATMKDRAKDFYVPPGTLLAPTFYGARAVRTTPYTIPSSTSQTINWEQAVFDVGDWFDPSNPQRLTVPSGVQFVDIVYQISYGGTGAGSGDSQSSLVRVRNGVSSQIALNLVDNFVSGSGLLSTATSGPIQVLPGDSFTVNMACWGNSYPIDIDHSFFSIKRLG